MLSGRAKVDFQKWAESNVFMVNHGCPESYLNALITEWLDSVDIHIEVTRLRMDDEPPVFWFYSVEGSEINKVPLETRNQATEKALEEAITIYNNR
jgi:hypothetical protein